MPSKQRANPRGLEPPGFPQALQRVLARCTLHSACWSGPILEFSGFCTNEASSMKDDSEASTIIGEGPDGDELENVF